MRIDKDLIQIIVIVIIGMYIPFMAAIIINFNVDISSFKNFLKVSSTFSIFLLFFALELLIVYLYFQLTNRIARKKIKKLGTK